jgi:hypothetical protein
VVSFVACILCEYLGHDSGTYIFPSWSNGTYVEPHLIDIMQLKAEEDFHQGGHMWMG